MVLVNVWMAAYNHEKYIAEAIEGVLMQRTDFDFDIVIGEDCSTDLTRQIVLSYKEKYPEKIRLILPEKNLGMNQMFKATYSLCTAPYVAWIDGDDYWTDPLKLQKQVDFLKKNRDFVFCFHNALIVDEIQGCLGEIPGRYYQAANNELSVHDFLREGNHVATGSVLYRNVLGDHLPEWYYNLPFLDLAFYFLLLKHGKARYFPEQMSVYRIHKGGSWSGNSAYENTSKYIEFNKLLNHHLDYVYNKEMLRIISSHSYELLKLDIAEKKVSKLSGRVKDVIRGKDIKFLLKRKRELPRLTLLTIRLLLKKY